MFVICNPMDAYRVKNIQNWDCKLQRSERKKSRYTSNGRSSRTFKIMLQVKFEIEISVTRVQGLVKAVAFR